MRIGLIYSGIFAAALTATWWLRQPDQVVRDAAPQLTLAAAPSAAPSLTAATSNAAAPAPVISATETARLLPGIGDERDAIAGDVYPVVGAIAADPAAAAAQPHAEPPADAPVNSLAVAASGDGLRDEIAGDVYPTVAFK